LIGSFCSKFFNYSTWKVRRTIVEEDSSRERKGQVTAYKIILKTKIQTENINTSKEIISFIKKKYIQNLQNIQTLIFFLLLLILLLACVREVEKMTTQNRQQKM
jgi:hypothetical protein